MPEVKHLKKRLEFSDFPATWSVRALSVDWGGEPVVLFEEGKPPSPQPNADTGEIAKWMNSPPTRHHLIHWHGGQPFQVSVENPANLTLTYHAQRFGDGWLLGDCRGGYTRICDKNGNLLRTLDLGDASEHLLTTPDGHIWVAYFDEGVFGTGISCEGLVCFDSSGAAIFRFNEFAQQNGLPSIADCYTLNVASSFVWLSYYTDFPLVCLKDFKLEGVWNNLEPNKAIAVSGERLVIFPAYRKPYLKTRTLKNAETTVWELADSDGKSLSKLVIGPPGTGRRVPFHCVARDSRLYVYDDVALYELP